MEKTGEVFYRDEEGRLFKAESFVDTRTGEVHTVDTPIDESDGE